MPGSGAARAQGTVIVRRHRSTARKGVILWCEVLSIVSGGVQVYGSVGQTAEKDEKDVKY
jgi:hypothetical protein